jgi:hypothetical protein
MKMQEIKIPTESELAELEKSKSRSFVNLKGKKFGRLTVIKLVFVRNLNRFLWLCQCDCGGENTVERFKLETCHTTSCGCAGIEHNATKFKSLVEKTVCEKCGIEYITNPSKKNTQGLCAKCLHKKSSDKLCEKYKQERRERGLYKSHKKNTSGAVGVHWNKRDKRWVAQIRVNNKTLSLGYFKDINDAIAARKAAEIEYGRSN